MHFHWARSMTARKRNGNRKRGKRARQSPSLLETLPKLFSFSWEPCRMLSFGLASCVQISGWLEVKLMFFLCQVTKRRGPEKERTISARTCCQRADRSAQDFKPT